MEIIQKKINRGIEIIIELGDRPSAGLFRMFFNISYPKWLNRIRAVQEGICQETMYYTSQSCKMDCEQLRLRKITISEVTLFIFLSAGRHSNISRFDFLGGRNCEIVKIVKTTKSTGF